MDLEEVVVVCPVDSCVEDEYFRALEELYRLIKSSEYKICLMGIKPTYPSEKYGYIIPQNKDKVSKVKTFKEKTDLETAKKYIENGALWNGGVFAFKLKYILDISHILCMGLKNIVVVASDHGILISDKE